MVEAIAANGRGKYVPYSNDEENFSKYKKNEKRKAKEIDLVNHEDTCYMDMELMGIGSVLVVQPNTLSIFISSHLNKKIKVLRQNFLFIKVNTKMILMMFMLMWLIRMLLIYVSI